MSYSKKELKKLKNGLNSISFGITELKDYIDATYPYASYSNVLIFATRKLAELETENKLLKEMMKHEST
jgi:hypothetical protein